MHIFVSIPVKAVYGISHHENLKYLIRMRKLFYLMAVLAFAGIIACADSASKAEEAAEDMKENAEEMATAAKTYLEESVNMINTELGEQKDKVETKLKELEGKTDQQSSEMRTKLEAAKQSLENFSHEVGTATEEGVDALKQKWSETKDAVKNALGEM